MNKKPFQTLAFDDEQINDELIDALIKAGSHEYIQNSTMEIPDDALSDEEFSKELDSKILNYIDTLDKQDRNQKVQHIFAQTKSIALRVAAVFLLLIVLTVGFVATSEAAQLQLLKMYIEHSDVSSNFEFIRPVANSNEDTPDSKTQEIHSLEHIFWYIPSGFELQYEDYSESVNIIRYENSSNDFIEIIQVQSGNMQTDTESANTYRTEINGLVCFVSEQSDTTIVVFHLDNENYNITSTLSIDEITKIIENIN